MSRLSTVKGNILQKLRLYPRYPRLSPPHLPLLHLLLLCRLLCSPIAILVRTSLIPLKLCFSMVLFTSTPFSAVTASDLRRHTGSLVLRIQLLVTVPVLFSTARFRDRLAKGGLLTENASYIPLRHTRILCTQAMEMQVYWLELRSFRTV